MGVDEGQIGVVSNVTPAMAWVTYPKDQSGGVAMKLKRPGSLIMLDPMVTVSQDVHGTMWIHPVAVRDNRTVRKERVVGAAEKQQSL